MRPRRRGGDGAAREPRARRAAPMAMLDLFVRALLSLTRFLETPLRSREVAARTDRGRPQR